MDVLVISATYEPLAAIPWQRAIQLWYAGRAEILETYPGRLLRSVTVAMGHPAVLRFNRARHVRRCKIRFSRRNVFARDHGRCQYCHRRLSLREATYDHVIPRAQGGPTRWDNIVIACRACNQRKGARTPDGARMWLNSEPARPSWLPLLRSGLRWRDEMPEIWRPYVTGVW